MKCTSYMVNAIKSKYNDIPKVKNIFKHTHKYLRNKKKTNVEVR